MNKLTEKLKNKTRSLLMTHLVLGYPTKQMSEEVAKTLAQNGADILEVQIPFSDPMADGPTIAHACRETLAKDFTVKDAINTIETIIGYNTPIVVMSYVNPIFRYGITRFVKKMASVGVSGLIIPDCPFDTPEGEEFLQACKKYDMHFIPVVSPGVPTKRLEYLAQSASGFWYVTSRRGTTGANSNFSKSLKTFVKNLRTITDLHIGIGFGVKTKTDIKNISSFADIVIAGSIFVSAIDKNAKNTKQLKAKIEELCM